MLLRLLTWNVSFEALKGERRGGYRYRRGNTNLFYRKGQAPCSQEYRTNTCFLNIAHLLGEMDPETDIFSFVESKSVLMENLYTDKKILRFYDPDRSTRKTSEIINVAFQQRFSVRQAGLFTLEVRSKSRPIAIVIFDQPALVLVTVHLDHPSDAEEKELCQALKESLEHLFGDTLAQHPVVITGDFNSEATLEGFENVNTGYGSRKTCFTIVKGKYAQEKNEQPLSYAYDRFVLGNQLQLEGFEVIRTPEMDAGHYSDHLPVRASLLVAAGSSLPGDLPDFAKPIESTTSQGFVFRSHPNSVQYLVKSWKSTAVAQEGGSDLDRQFRSFVGEGSAGKKAFSSWLARLKT
jgi:hypothetical protein